MPRANSFRIGKVTGYLRGRFWYLCYFEHGQRKRPRVGLDHAAARQLAARINDQLESGAPSAFSFEPLSITALRDRWFEHHDQVRRSSVYSVNRYRTATNHLLRFFDGRPLRHAGLFSGTLAVEFVRDLRSARVSPNGHPNTPQRPHSDKGVRYVLECCRALFNFAAWHRHLLGEAVKLWSALAASPTTKVGLDGRCPTAVALITIWLAVGAVTETRLAGHSEYTRANDPLRPALGKCAICGQVLCVPLAKLLDAFPCPKCHQSRLFVIVGRSS